MATPILGSGRLLLETKWMRVYAYGKDEQEIVIQTIRDEEVALKVGMASNLQSLKAEAQHCELTEIACAGYGNGETAFYVHSKSRPHR